MPLAAVVPLCASTLALSPPPPALHLAPSPHVRRAPYGVISTAASADRNSQAGRRDGNYRGRQKLRRAEPREKAPRVVGDSLSPRVLRVPAPRATQRLQPNCPDKYIVAWLSSRGGVCHSTSPAPTHLAWPTPLRRSPPPSIPPSRSIPVRPHNQAHTGTCPKPTPHLAPESPLFGSGQPRFTSFPHPG